MKAKIIQKILLYLLYITKTHKIIRFKSSCYQWRGDYDICLCRYIYTL